MSELKEFRVADLTLGELLSSASEVNLRVYNNRKRVEGNGGALLGFRETSKTYDVTVSIPISAEDLADIQARLAKCDQE